MTLSLENRISRLATNGAVSMARQAIAAAETGYPETAQKRLATACYYEDKVTDETDREVAHHYVEAARGAIKIHCPEALES